MLTAPLPLASLPSARDLGVGSGGKVDFGSCLLWGGGGRTCLETGTWEQPGPTWKELSRLLAEGRLWGRDRSPRAASKAKARRESLVLPGEGPLC